MEDSAYLMQLLAAFFYTAASVALLRLSARTGQRPERLLGFALLFCGLSYFFYQIPYVVGSESLLVPLSFLGRIATAAGVIAVAMFTRLAFRRDADVFGRRGVAGLLPPRCVSKLSWLGKSAVAEAAGGAEG